jgi:hypothetical protein
MFSEDCQSCLKHVKAKLLPTPIKLASLDALQLRIHVFTNMLNWPHDEVPWKTSRSQAVSTLRLI